MAVRHMKKIIYVRNNLSGRRFGIKTHSAGFEPTFVFSLKNFFPKINNMQITKKTYINLKTKSPTRATADGSCTSFQSRKTIAHTANIENINR